MFFTRLARVVAFIALVLGIVHLAMAIAIAGGMLGPGAAERYLVSTVGEAIDRGAYMVIFSIALGTLAEISAKI